MEFQPAPSYARGVNHDAHGNAPTDPWIRALPRLIRRRRWRFLATGSVLLLLVAYLLRVPLLGPIVSGYVLRAIEEEAGFECSIGSLGGSWLTDLEIHDLRTVQPARLRAVQSVRAELVSVRYSLVKRWLGSPDWVEAIRLRAADVAIDLEHSDTTDAFELPATLPDMEVQDLGIRLIGRDLYLRARPVALRCEAIGAGESRITVEAREVSYGVAQARRSGVTLAGSIRYHAGRTHVELITLDGEPILEEIDLDLRNPAALAFLVSGAPLTPGSSLTLRGGIREGRVAGEMQVAELDLERWARQLGLGNLGLAGQLNLDARLDLPIARPAQGEGRVRLLWSDARIAKEKIEQVQAQVELKEGNLRFPRFTVRQAGNEFTLRDAEVPIPGGPLDPWTLLSGASGTVELEFSRFDRLLSRLHGSAALLSPGPLELKLRGNWRERGLRGASASLQGPGNGLSLPEFSVQLPDRLSDWRAIQADAELHVELLDIAAVGAYFGDANVEGSLKGEVTTRGSLGALSGTARLTGEDLRYHQWLFGAVALSLRADSNAILLEEASLHNEHVDFVAVGAYDLAQQTLRDTLLTGHIRDLGAATRRPDEFRGGVQFQLTATGSLRDPASRVTLRWLDGECAGLEFEELTAEAQLRSDGLEFRQLTLRMADEVFELEAPGRLRRDPTGSWSLDELKLNSTAGALRLSGSLSADGVLEARLDVEEFRARDVLSALLPEGLEVGVIERLHLERRPGAGGDDLTATLRDVSFRGLPIDQLELAASREGERWILSELHAESGGERLLEVHGSLHPDALELEGEFRLPEWRMPLPPPWRELLAHDLTASLRLSGTRQRPVLRANWKSGRIATADLSFESTQGTLQFDEQGLRLIDGIGRGQVLELRATAGWGTKLYPDRTPMLEWDAPLRGSAQLLVRDLSVVRFLFPALRELSGNLLADIEVEGTPLQPTFGGTTQLQEGQVAWHRLPPPHRVSGDARLTFEALRFQAPDANRLPLPWRGKLEVIEFAARGLGGSLSAAGVLDTDGEHQFQLSARSLPLRELAGPLLRADVHPGTLVRLEGQIAGPAAAPRITLDGEFGGVHLDQGPILDLRFSLLQDHERLEVHQFDADRDGVPVLACSGTLPLVPWRGERWGPEPLALRARLTPSLPPRVPPDAWPISFPSATVIATLAGTASVPDLHFEADLEDVRLHVEEGPVPPHPGKVRLEGRFHRGGVEIESLQATSDSFTCEGAGSWSLPGALPGLLRGKAVDWRKGEVSTRLEIGTSDIEWLRPATPVFRRLGGTARISLYAHGPLSRPELDGRLRLEQGEIRFAEPGLPAFRNLSADVDLHWNRAEIRRLVGELGSEPFEVKGSWNFPREGGSEFDLTLEGKELLLYRAQGIKIRADTLVTLQGPVEKMRIGGSLAITDGRYVRSIDLLRFDPASSKMTGSGLQLFTWRDPTFGAIEFDLKIHSKAPFEIKNNLLKGSFRPEMRLVGTGEVPLLLGNVYIQPTSLTLPGSTLRISQGILRFLESNPYQPQVELTGGNRMQGYDIRVAATGPYNEPVIQLSSTPPLADRDILLLLTTGQRPRDDQDLYSRSQAALGTIALFLGRDILLRWFDDQSTESEESILERFEMETGRDISKQGNETIEARFRLVQGILRDSDVLYLEGEKDAFDDYNLGFKIVFRFQ